MAKDKSPEVFVLVTETLQGYNGDIVRFADPVSTCIKADNTRVGTVKANEDLREQAKKVGANAVLGVRYQFEWLSQRWYVCAVGTPAYLDPPLIDPDEYIKNLQDSSQ